MSTSLGRIFRDQYQNTSLFSFAAFTISILYFFLKFTYSSFVKTRKISFKFANCCSILILLCIFEYLKSISGCPISFFVVTQISFLIKSILRAPLFVDSNLLVSTVVWKVFDHSKIVLEFKTSFLFPAKFKQKKYFTYILHNLQTCK